MITAFQLGQILYEARIREAWGSAADDRLGKLPWPRHEGAERGAEHDLAIAQAKALLKRFDITARPAA